MWFLLRDNIRKRSYPVVLAVMWVIVLILLLSFSLLDTWTWLDESVVGRVASWYKEPFFLSQSPGRSGFSLQLMLQYLRRQTLWPWLVLEHLLCPWQRNWQGSIVGAVVSGLLGWWGKYLCCVTWTVGLVGEVYVLCSLNCGYSWWNCWLVSPWKNLLCNAFLVELWADFKVEWFAERKKKCLWNNAKVGSKTFVCMHVYHKTGSLMWNFFMVCVYRLDLGIGSFRCVPWC